MYEIEEDNPSIIRYINEYNIYRIHPTVYIGFNNQLYRQYNDSIWVYASEYIENLNKDFHDKTFIVKSDENFKYKSFFLIKKSDIEKIEKIEKEYKLWDCMVYVISNQDDIDNQDIPSIILNSLFIMRV
jgi:hypothetical protein